MWKPSFLQQWLIFAVFCGLVQNCMSSQDQNLTDSDLDRIADEVLISLTEAHSTEAKVRSKRDVSSKEVSMEDDKGVYRLHSFTPVAHLCYPSLYTKFLNVENVTYVVCASAITLYSPAEVAFGIYKDKRWTIIHRWYTGNPNGLALFSSGAFLYILVADSDNYKGTELVRINLSTMEKYVSHLVHSKYPTAISVWKMSINGKSVYHLAIANSPAISDKAMDYTSEILISEWFDTYFDQYTVVKANDVKDIVPFHIHGDAYLAIANYRKGKNNFQVDSEILKYNLDQKKWLSHQKIRTYGASDWEFFSLGSGIGSDFFLAVANKEGHRGSNIKTTIYKFVRDKFVPFQCLPTVGATSITSSSSDNAFILAVSSSIDSVTFYQYDGWRFILSNIQYTQGTMSYGVKHLTFHKAIEEQGSSLIISVSNPRHLNDPSIFEIGFIYENLLQEWSQKSTEWCQRTMDKVDETETDSIVNLLDNTIFVDQTEHIVIKGDVYFENGFKAEMLETPQLKEIGTQSVYDNTLFHELEKMQNRLQQISERLLHFEEIVNNSVKIYGDQIINSSLEFKDVSFDCEKHSCLFDSIHTTILNGEEIGNWGENLVFLDSDKFINGSVFIEQISANNINIQGLIDGIEMKKLVTKSNNQIVTGYKNFHNDVYAKETIIHGLMNNIKISSDSIFLTFGHQNVTGDLHFEEIDTSWLEVKKNINNKDIALFFKDVVRSNLPAELTGQKEFQNIVVDDLYMCPGCTINGIDIIDLYEHALWKKGKQEIKAPMALSSFITNGNIKVFSGINGVLIPGPQVVNIYGHAIINATHNFMGLSKITQLQVLQSLNSLKVLSGETPYLDIFLNTGEQIITGKKNFHSILLDSDSYISGKVDGIDLSEFKDNVLKRDKDIVSNRTWVFNNLVIKGPLVVDKISGYNLDEIYGRALNLNDGEIPEMNFKEVVYIDDLESYNINGINIRNDLVLVNEPQHITGKKVFKEIVLEENSIILGTVNNLNITFLNETILRIGNQVLKSKVFHRNVKMNRLTVKGSINNVLVNELVSLHNEKAMLHSNELFNVTFDKIETNNVEVFGKINSVDISEILRDTMTYEGHEVVKGSKTVKGSIFLNGNDFISHNVNNVNISQLFHDAVFLDIPQEVFGTKTFLNNVTFNSLISNSNMDGIIKEDMDRWMLKDKTQYIHGNVFFTSGLSANYIHVLGFINDINITELNINLVKINEENVIEGPIIFQDLTSEENIEISGKIQGVDLQHDIVTKSGDKIVKSTKGFLQDITVDGNLIVSGLVDNIPLQDLCRSVFLVKKEEYIPYLTIKGDVTFMDGGTIDGKIAGIELQELQKIAVSTEDISLDFSGYKSFRSLAIEGPIYIEGTLGGIDLQHFNQTYLSLSQDQNLTEKMDFEEMKISGSLIALNFDTSNKLVNGINVADLGKRMLKIYGTQYVTANHQFEDVTFIGDVLVVGKVNDFEVPNSFMRQDEPNVIKSPKIFEKPVSIKGNLIMDENKLIQGVDVSVWKKKAVMKSNGKFQLEGSKTFHNISLRDSRIMGLLDGLKISESSLLMAYGDQIITGHKLFKNRINIEGDVNINGFINRQDLNYLLTKTFQRGHTNIVTGIKSFMKPLSINSLEAPSVSGVDIIELNKRVNGHLDFTYLQSRLQEIENVITDMQVVLSKQAVLFQYYEEVQKFHIPTLYGMHYAYGNDCGELLLLSDNSSSQAHCTSLRVFEFHEHNDQFEPHFQELRTSYAISIQTLFVWDATYLFIANQHSIPSCSNDQVIGNGNTTADIYRWNKNNFEKLHALEVKPAEHMVVFVAGLLTCMLYLELDSSKIFCSDGPNKNFHLWEILQTKGGRKASAVTFHEETFLAIIAEDISFRPSYIEGEKPVDLYLWKPEESVFASPFQIILSMYAQSVMFMSHLTHYSTYLFLVVVEGSIPRIQNDPKVHIYRYNINTRFEKYQVINDYGVLDWLVLPTGELVLYVLNPQKGTVNLYQLKGESKFVHIDTVVSIGSIGIKAFIRHNDSNKLTHYLGLFGPQTQMAQPAQGTDYAKLLKAKVKGKQHSDFIV